MILRPYQSDLTARTREAFRTHRRVFMVLPTGGGKTVIFSYITKSAAAKLNRVIITVHRSEIIDQISAALADFSVPHGRIQPGYMMTDDYVQIAMIQTLARRLDKIETPDLIVIDEGHHAITPAYQALMNAFPQAKVLIVSATPERLDGKGLGDIADVMVLGPPTRKLIECGFLADFDYYAPPSNIDLSSVATRMGDYANDALAAALDKPKITGSAVTHYQQLLAGKPAIAFCVNVQHAYHVAAEFSAAGIASAGIDGTLPAGERARRVAALRSGEIKVLTSADLISEGFDVPGVYGAILLRPTKSLALHLQQCGRALRPKPDGSKATILDHVGNCDRHGTPRSDRQWSLEAVKRPKSAGIRQCKACFKAFDIGDKYDCPDKRDGCLFGPRMADAVEPRKIEVVEGSLAAITETPPWAGGINIVRASGPEFKSMLARAGSMAELMEIARARNYKPAWAYHIMKTRRERASAMVGE